jgi:hypothetical protein
MIKEFSPKRTYLALLSDLGVYLPSPYLPSILLLLVLDIAAAAAASTVCAAFFCNNSSCHSTEDMLAATRTR